MSDTEHISQLESAKRASSAPNLITQDALLTDLLRGVSRSFFLTLRILPSKFRVPIGLAYLLARTADTIADTKVLPPRDRLKHLLSFRAQVQGPTNPNPLQYISEALRDHGSNPDDRELLISAPKTLALLETLSEKDQRSVRSVVTTLTEGMEIDLQTFPSEISGKTKAFTAPEDLDRYIFLVAGCVGSFWTDIITAHTSALTHWDVELMSKIGIRFGKALQLTNVLRDVPKDLQIGRCYLPSNQLNAEGLNPEDLRMPINSSKARPVLKIWLHTVLGHYEAAEKYLLAIPNRCPRLRLAVLWPILIGLKTLSLLAQKSDWLESEKTAKVSRRWISWMIIRSIPIVLSNRLLSIWISRLRRDVQQASLAGGPMC